MSDQVSRNKPFVEVALAMGLKYPVTQRGMRRTFQDLARAAEVADLVTRSISGHSTERMQHHYSTVSPNEQRQGLAKVIQFARRPEEPESTTGVRNGVGEPSSHTTQA